jgi:type VI secretion system secreted protein VgrG
MTDKDGKKVSPTAQALPPPGNWTPGQQQKMQEDVNNACKRERSCKNGQMKIEMVINRLNSLEFAVARDRINKVCFMGGDVNHRNEASDGWRSVAKRDGMIRD